MTVLDSHLFKRFILGRKGDAAEPTRKDAGPPTRSDAVQDTGQLPLPGYDNIKDKDLIAGLSKHSQVELAAIETYERSHKERLAVFDKLRYLRGPEPLQDYDALSVEAILAQLEGADTATLQRTRVYERKFRGRHQVLEAVAASIHEHNPSVHRG